ncbi:GlsB/YeaQ/YmgE family stress response membrane protein [Nakamurella endophytica]|uniref:Transglycosylase n=1 Tax=Nakamurella endophytica TaxID=1748367 RepID=A0A917TEZ3_9ACTN|nr:GlsB/YeaQ/YmgE family stress response membrane protein [Nakamurella endophytica]GGM18260.1 transglycosylase [Nakamurella endophytica]
MSWIGWIVFGALAGWVANLVVRDGRRGCLTTVVTGILGAVLGGFVYRLAAHRPWTFGWDWPSFGVAVLGSLALLVVVSLVTRPQRSRRDR